MAKMVHAKTFRLTVAVNPILELSSLDDICHFRMMLGQKLIATEEQVTDVVEMKLTPSEIRRSTCPSETDTKK